MSCLVVEIFYFRKNMFLNSRRSYTFCDEIVVHCNGKIVDEWLMLS